MTIRLNNRGSNGCQCSVVSVKAATAQKQEPLVTNSENSSRSHKDGAFPDSET
jgi:hypothetical protein